MGYRYPGLCARYGEMNMLKAAGILGMSFNSAAVAAVYGISEQTLPFLALASMIGLAGGMTGFAAANVLHGEVNNRLMDNNVGIGHGVRLVRRCQATAYAACVAASVPVSIYAASP